MAEIDLEAARNDAAEKYGSLIDDLSARISDDGQINISPEEFVQAVNDGGLDAVFGDDNAGDASIYLGNGTDDAEHPLVIEIGTVPDGERDYSDSDGNARITIDDDRLSEIRDGVNAEARGDALEALGNLTEDRIDAVEEYRIETVNQGDAENGTERTIDVVHPEDSDVQILIDSDSSGLGLASERHDEVGNNLELHAVGETLPAGSDAVRSFISDNPDDIESMTVHVTNDESGAGAVSVDVPSLGIRDQEMFVLKEGEAFDPVGFVGFIEDNSDAVGTELARGDTFDSYEGFIDAVEERSEWTDYLADHADAEDYLNAHLDDFNIDPAATAPQDIMEAINTIEEEGLTDRAVNDAEHGDADSFIDRLEDAKEAIMDGISSLLDSIFGDLEKDKEEDVDKDSDKAAGSVDGGSGHDGADAEKQNENIDAEKTEPADIQLENDKEDDHVDIGNDYIDGGDESFDGGGWND